jgi:uncharacterized CHY-type Zn-finger protein
MTLLPIPSEEETSCIAKAFLSDLKSFTVTDEDTKHISPVICSVCDSMPTESKWYETVDLHEFIDLCEKGKLRKTDALKLYSEDLLNQYTAKDERLKDFILSPKTYVNAKDKVLVCAKCLTDLKTNSKTQKSRRRAPPESIICGYMIGDAPEVLTCLNPVELALITKTVTQCQSWVFFAGSHQSIKGWHTFFKGRPGENIGNLTLMTESGWKGKMLVVMCGPFTNEQYLKTKAKTSVNPDKVIAAFKWLKENNYRYRDIEIPNSDDIPQPYIMDEER